jgi:hypothetical protein
MGGDNPERLDAPNQQVVRADQSAPWDEGTGGEAGKQPAEQEAAEQQAGLEAMTKDELLAYAQERDISPANASMTKADILSSIQAAGEET